MATQADRKNPKVSKKIHEYWYKEVTGERADYWANRLGDSSYENIVEGNGKWCYACGKESGHLQRCHIVPHCLGGGVEDSNMFLLCNRCHQDNPDTVFIELFFDYVKTKNFWLDEIAIETSKVLLKLVAANPDIGNRVLQKLDAESFGIEKYLEDRNISESVGVGCNNLMSYTTMAGALYHTLAKDVEQELLPT